METTGRGERRGRGDWRPFLERWSGEWVDGHGPGADEELVPEVRRDRWLGFEPAAEAEVAAAEARLGRRLPPSLRDFLLVTNGWRDTGSFIYRLAGAAELAWLADTDDRDWIEVYEDLAEEGPEETAGDGDEGDDGGWDPVNEARVLRRALRLSLEGDAAVMLLDPEDVDADGEWAGYWLASWSGEGPQRFGSFYDLMRDMYVSFHALRQPPGPTRDHWDAEVERARVAALGGAVDEPLEVFAAAVEYGRQRAALLRTQLLGMRGEWEPMLLDTVLHVNHDGEPAFQEPLFSAELLPLMVAQETARGPGAYSTVGRLKRDGSAATRAAVMAYEARCAEPGYRLGFGNPEFDAAVRAISDRLAAEPAFLAAGHPPPRIGPLVIVAETGAAAPRDPVPDYARVRADRAALLDAAWPELKAAFAWWRPRCEDHIAPVVLFADPLIAAIITPERGAELIATARG
ncbi:SMI1/KNR4 family protein [Streptomyces sp. CA-111067]|uniref:SMI1/KNR4 family protein n=1 Tax=Streptomyces sp. CA-111067 TaxID=3240046 RepID=UPI003D96E251